MWFRIIGAAVDSFLTSLWSGWFHDRSVKKAEDEKVEATIQNAELKTQVQAVEAAYATRDQIRTGTLPADVAQRVRGQYVD